MKKFIKNPSKENDPLAGDLSDIIGKAKWRKVRFILAPKDTTVTDTVTLRMSKNMVDAAKKAAKKEGVKYHRLMRDAIASYLMRAA